MSDINATAQQVIEQNRSQVSAQINSVFSALVSNAPKTQLPEHVFISYFLPFFAGELDNPVLANRSPLTDWISIAGSPMAEVDIVDAGGNIAFTTPCLFDTNIIDIVNRKPGESLSDVYTQYDLRSNVPTAANNYLMNALYNKSIQITNNEQSLNSSKARWETILKRYGKIISGSSIQNSVADDPSDDVVYD